MSTHNSSYVKYGVNFPHNDQNKTRLTQRLRRWKPLDLTWPEIEDLPPEPVDVETVPTASAGRFTHGDDTDDPTTRCR